MVLVDPLPINSQHQDDTTCFRLGDSELNLHLPLAYWEGVQLNMWSLRRFLGLLMSSPPSFIDATKLKSTNSKNLAKWFIIFHQPRFPGNFRGVPFQKATFLR